MSSLSAWLFRDDSRLDLLLTDGDRWSFTGMELGDRLRLVCDTEDGSARSLGVGGNPRLRVGTSGWCGGRLFLGSTAQRMHLRQYLGFQGVTKSYSRDHLAQEKLTIGRPNLPS